MGEFHCLDLPRWLVSGRETLSKKTQPECHTQGCPGILLMTWPNWDSLARELLTVFGQMSKEIVTDLWLATAGLPFC